MPYFAIKSDDDVFDSVTPQAITARFVPESSVCCERGQKMPCRAQNGRLVALSAAQANARASRRRAQKPASNPQIDMQPVTRS